jgi:thiosulfate dehydrogenase
MWWWLLWACGPAPDRMAEVPMRATATVIDGASREASAVRPASGPPASPAVPTVGRWAPIDPASLPEGLVATGYAQATDTARVLGDYVGDSALNCTSCHTGAAATPKAGPWVGVTQRYPQHRARTGKVDDIEERVNDCMTRSMNGQALPRDSEPMKAFVAYMTWLSEGVPEGGQIDGVGFPKIKPPEAPDPERGALIFAQRCASCHGPEGLGVYGPDGAALFPPLAGPRSFNVGAGLARLHTTAAFVKWNMPKGQGGTLTDQEAYDVARYVAFLDRPDFSGKENDWPAGGKPDDARY